MLEKKHKLLAISSKSILLFFCLSIVSITAASVNYTYDVLGRLIKEAYSNGLVITYTYDAAGNRTRVVTSGS